MFYCDECQVRNSWPEGFMKSYGPCEMCKKPANCNDVPSKFLPPAPTSWPAKERTEALNRQPEGDKPVSTVEFDLPHGAIRYLEGEIKRAEGAGDIAHDPKRDAAIERLWDLVIKGE